VNRVFIVGLDVVMRTTFNVIYYLLPEYVRNAVVIVGPYELKE